MVQKVHLPNDAEFKNLVMKVASRLTALDAKMATAESCTGGWIAKCCTDQAGSSAWFERGFVSYSNSSKVDLLGVDAATLETLGAVSSEVALQMAQGACLRSGADIAVAVTGIAGPEGGSVEKPVGTVWFGWSCHGRTDTAMVRFAGDRDAVRRQTVAYALQGLLERLAP